MNTIAIIKASLFQREGSTDKNGEQALILTPIAGTVPNKMVRAGTICKREGFEDSKTYLVQVRETETDPQYGRQFDWKNLGELHGLELLKAINELGEAKVVDVKKVEEVAETAVTASKATAI